MYKCLNISRVKIQRTASQKKIRKLLLADGDEISFQKKGKGLRKNIYIQGIFRGD